MVKYDIYDTNNDLYNWTGIDSTDLCVDFYGMNPNIDKKRYILTPIKLPFKIVKSYGLLMRPIELNVKYCVEGHELFIYDTEGVKCVMEGQSLPLSVTYYYLRLFNLRMAKEYVLSRYNFLIQNKIKKLFNKV
jgi:hypothetical protein